MSYCISTNEESFFGEYESQEDALREAINQERVEAGQKLWIGQTAERKASNYVGLDSLVEGMAERAYEEVGEAAEGWPDLSPEDQEKLEKLIGDFLNEHSPVSFFAVEDVEKIEVTPELIAKYYVVRRCRVCGCTDADCRQCIEKTGEPCHWIEPDLCSACAGDQK